MIGGSNLLGIALVLETIAFRGIVFKTIIVIIIIFFFFGIGPKFYCQGCIWSGHTTHSEYFFHGTIVLQPRAVPQE
jgi:hypothetical protein